VEVTLRVFANLTLQCTLILIFFSSLFSSLRIFSVSNVRLLHSTVLVSAGGILDLAYLHSGHSSRLLYSILLIQLCILVMVTAS